VYKVLFTPGAVREFRHLRDRDRQSAAHIEDAVDELSSEPRPVGVVKLRGDVHRIRVGQFRIIYSIVDRDQVLLVSRIRRRSETTYRGI
jgi:mRNA-degrading endonuclease RelE of RelBE toxin-antitoxin system